MGTVDLSPTFALASPEFISNPRTPASTLTRFHLKELYILNLPVTFSAFQELAPSNQMQSEGKETHGG